MSLAEIVLPYRGTVFTPDLQDFLPGVGRVPPPYPSPAGLKEAHIFYWTPC